MFYFMRIIVEKFGTYISKKKNRFLISLPKENKKQEFHEYSSDKVNQIIFIGPSAISSEAVKLAIEKNIDILYLNFRGEPYARIYPCRLGGTTLTRRKQLEVYFSEKGIKLVKSFVEGKIKSQSNYLKSLAKDRKDKIGKLSKIELSDFKIMTDSVDELRKKLLGFEGSAAAKYFKTLGILTGYSKRDPYANDPFNICLNYAYGILYSETEKACILAGLDPYLGFYHTDRYGKPSMVLDIMELFRVAVADRAVVTLFNRKEIKDDDFEEIGERILSQKGRKKIISAIIGRLNTIIRYKGKKLAIKDIILAQTREIAAYLLGHKRDFKPFIYYS